MLLLFQSDLSSAYIELTLFHNPFYIQCLVINFEFDQVVGNFVFELGCCNFVIFFLVLVLVLLLPFVSFNKRADKCMVR